jgi:putative endonuclease
MLASEFSGTLYVGVTSDLAARLYQHREGITGGFTAQHDVKRLVWFEIHDDMLTAIAREKTIKKWPRQWKRNVIEALNPLWEDLAVGLGFEPIPQR